MENTNKGDDQPSTESIRVTEMQKTLSLIISDTIQEQINKIKDAEKVSSGNYDGRSKENRNLAKVEKIANDIIEQDIEEQASRYIASNKIPLSFDDGFELGILPHTYFRGANIEMSVYVGKEQRYSSERISLEKPVSEVIEYITQEHNVFTEKNSVEAKRIETAQAVLKEINEVSYKDASWKMRDGKAWEGSRLELRYEDPKQYDNSARVTADIDKKDQIRMNLDLRMTVTTVQESVDFWNEAKALVEKYKNLTKKEESN